MSPLRALLRRRAATGTASLSRLGILVLAVLLTLAIYVVGVSVERFGEASPLLLMVPLALARSHTGCGAGSEWASSRR